MQLVFVQNNNNEISYNFNSEWYYAFRGTSLNTGDTIYTYSTIFYNHDGTIDDDPNIVAFFNSIKDLIDIKQVLIFGDSSVPIFDNLALDLQYNSVALRQSNSSYDFGLQFIIKYDMIISDDEEE